MEREGTIIALLTVRRRFSKGHGWVVIALATGTANILSTYRELAFDRYMTSVA